MLHVRMEKARVVALPKSPEKPLSDVASYGHISILYVLGSTLERFMIVKIESKLNGRKNDALHEFRRG